MGDVIGYGTAFKNPDNGGAWEAAEGTDLSQTEVIGAIKEVVNFYDMTQEEFEGNEPLFLTEIHKVRQITWEDVQNA